jgi:hypothetical protein
MSPPGHGHRTKCGEDGRTGLWLVVQWTNHVVAVMIGRLWLVAWWANHVVAVVQGMFRITSYVNNGVTPEIVNIYCFFYLLKQKKPWKARNSLKRLFLKLIFMDNFRHINTKIRITSGFCLTLN